MPPVVYTGALQPKKKSELQEIAVALRLSDHGTKDELHARIKRHLDSNQSALEDDPVFAGLFGRRKRSVQPQSGPPSTRFAPAAESSSDDATRRGISSLDPIRESTPVKDLRDVSTFLKHPFSPREDTPDPEHTDPDNNGFGTPSSLPPLPPSSPAKSLIEHFPKPPDVAHIVNNIKQQQIDVIQNGSEILLSVRSFLSNSRNIWSLTALIELASVLLQIIPWKSLQIPLTPKGGPSLPIYYPPIAIFQTSAFWLTLFHWAIPTLIVPAFVGHLISFAAPMHPTTSQFDPLTASIVRLAAQIVYPFQSLEFASHTVGLDVLGFNLRVVNASVGVAFAFAEAIAGAPQLFAKTLIKENHRLALTPSQEGESSLTPSRRALTAAGDDTPEDELE